MEVGEFTVTEILGLQELQRYLDLRCRIRTGKELFQNGRRNFVKLARYKKSSLEKEKRGFLGEIKIRQEKTNFC